MSKKKTARPADKRAAKRAAVLGSEKKSRLPFVICLILLALAPVGAYVILNNTDSGSISTRSADTPPTAAAASEQTEVVTYPVAMFEDGKAHHFDHRFGDMTIRYFVLKSSDGVIRAAFDACDVCWPAGKGYVQDGDVMICRNCGRRFSSVKINEVKGGCNPAPLKRAVDGDQVMLRVTDIRDGKAYFNFSGKA